MFKVCSNKKFTDVALRMVVIAIKEWTFELPCQELANCATKGANLVPLSPVDNTGRILFRHELLITSSRFQKPLSAHSNAASVAAGARL